MFVEVTLSPAASSPALRDVDNFRDFKVVVLGTGDRSRLAGALEGIGRLDGDDAFLDIAAVKELAGERARDPEWLASFDGMVEYARSKGWLDPGGTALRAHCERRP